MRLGGVSDPRNKTLMKMFNLINIGERAGSGVPKIFNIWADEGWKQPEIIEEFDPDRTVLVLPLEKEKNSNSDFFNKTLQQLKNDSIIKLIEYLDENEEITTAKGVEITGKSAAQVRRYLKALCKVGILKSTKATKGNIFIKQ